MLGARHVTALVLGTPSTGDAGNWLELGPCASGATVVSERFARRRLPAAAVEAMRAKPCFYICVDDADGARAHVPGAQVGHTVVSHGMREICIEAADGIVVLAERI